MDPFEGSDDIGGVRANSTTGVPRVRVEEDLDTDDTHILGYAVGFGAHGSRDVGTVAHKILIRGPD